MTEFVATSLPSLLDGKRSADEILHGDAQGVRVRVTNQGQPIPAASLGAIFKPLVQLPEEGGQDERPRTSLGLGLFVAREIAEAHGGTIGVQSDAARGTVFTVRIPGAALPERAAGPLPL